MNPSSLGWSRCRRWRGWPMAWRQARANSSSSRGRGSLTSAPKCSSTSSSWVRGWGVSGLSTLGGIGVTPYCTILVFTVYGTNKDWSQWVATSLSVYMTTKEKEECLKCTYYVITFDHILPSTVEKYKDTNLRVIDWLINGMDNIEPGHLLNTNKWTSVGYRQW